MQENLPFVSIIIPCRNEQIYLSQCLNSLIANGYPKDRLEILIIDGMSEDGTKKIIEGYSQKFPFIRLLENPKRFTPAGLNIGLKEAKGEIIIRMDAHATYEQDYIAKCQKYLQEYNADNVGGIIKTIPQKNTISAKAIAYCLSHPFGVAGSYFRIGSKGSKEVDTVFGGCYKKEVFEKIGFFNENLKRSQDIEFNLRLKKAGGKILLVPDIVSYYYPKANLKEFFIHNFGDGVWAIYPLKFIKLPFGPRHYLPLIFVLTLIGTGFLGMFFPIFSWILFFAMGLYLLINLYFSAKISAEKRDLRYLFFMPTVFCIRHIGYGLGSLWGLIKLI